MRPQAPILLQEEAKLMKENHVSRELMQRFFRSELSWQDTYEVVQHLMWQCGTCLGIAAEAGVAEGYVYQEGDFQRAFFPDDLKRYGFLRLLGSVEEVELELAVERLRGIGLWRTLEKHDQDRRFSMIKSNSRMHTWGLYDRLLEQCREMGFRAPADAVEIAELALVVVDMLDPVRYGAAHVADFRVGALAALGNAKRLASDFEGARIALGYASEELRQGTGDSLGEAGLLCLQASWHKDLGEFEEAMGILDRVATIYHEQNDPHLEGWILIKQAATIGHIHPERAVELAQKGLTLIDSLRDPRLEWCGWHNLAVFLNEAGRPQEALAILEISRPLYEQFQDPWMRIRLHWLEGEIARSLEDLVKAEEIFKRLWYDLPQGGLVPAPGETDN
jgi:tetratricopeptide (TPR) repeat protein